MAQRAIREFHAKQMLAKYWSEYFGKGNRYEGNVLLVTPKTDLGGIEDQNEWLSEKRLVVKPDQLFGKRGKNKLILVDASLKEAVNWIKERMGKKMTIGGVTGNLTHFLIEPFVPHTEEYYVAIKSDGNTDKLLFSVHGGIDIEVLWSTVTTISISVLDDIDTYDISSKLPSETPQDNKETLSEFLKGLFRFYIDFDYTYLEINPFALSEQNIIPLDLVARLDDTAHYRRAKKWEGVEFPPPFGRNLSPEEKYISELDRKSGASMKLSVFNPKGRIWTLVAGGGASVIYADTIVDLGLGDELANYGEYSGNPSTDETYEYVKTILSLMTSDKDKRGKVLIIGGGIANFTDVSTTFTGIIKAIQEVRDELIENKVSIYVRRGGPNYKIGLENIEKSCKAMGIPIHVHGPELHMTRIVKNAIEEMEGGNASE